MNILKFTKKKNGFYELLLENDEKLLIHEDLILKYDLLLSRKLDKNIDIILNENNYYYAYDKAIKYISVKVRSTYELKKYLLKLDMDDSIIDYVVSKITKQGYLNDKTYASLYVKDRIALSNDGPKKISSTLRDCCIDEEFINEAISDFNPELQRKKINILISKQVKSNTNKGSNYLKQKIVMNLINLGYDRDLIMEVLESFDIDDSAIYQKEYNKVKEKLSKKYSGKELEYRIKQSLYQKGFRL